MACSAPLHQLLAIPSARAPNMAESEVVGAKMMGDYANFIDTGHRNFIRVLIPHQILRKIRIYGFLWHPMSSSMQLWNVSPPEYLISRSKDFKTIGPDALIRPATHGGLPVGWKKSGWTDHWNSWVPMAIFLPRSSSYALLMISQSQCCPRSLSPYGVTRPQWVKIATSFSIAVHSRYPAVSFLQTAHRRQRQLIIMDKIS